MTSPDRPPLPPAPATDPIEVSFVMPCLNEAETIERCVQAAWKCIREHGLSGEVVVGDNGSTDGSQELATRAGARVVPIPVRGYGAALDGAIAAARGKYIIMGDSDLQHDFGECFVFVESLRKGYDLVMGSRRLGRVMPGAMKWKNRYIGAPVLSLVGRVLFKSPVSDFHCGLRAFTKSSYQGLRIRTTGMEFASEHIIKATLAGHKITDVPITVYPEGRSRPPHLRPWRDGWRHLRFMLLLSPRFTFLLPGLGLMLGGLMLSALVVAGKNRVLGLDLDIHTLVLGCLCVLVGFTALSIGAAARIYAIEQELGPPPKYQQRLFSIFTLERGLIAGGAVLAVGVVLVGALVYKALTVHIQPDEVGTTMRHMIVGSTLIALGVQTVLMSFFYSMLGIKSQRPTRPGASPP